MVGCVIYIIWGTSHEQPWNNYSTKDTELGEELQKLKPPSSTIVVNSTKNSESKPEKEPKNETHTCELKTPEKTNNA